MIEDVLKEKKFVISGIQGTSMMPMLRQGIDTVKVVPYKGKAKEGDVLLFKRPSGQYTLHRVVKVKKDYYVICGDNRTYREKIPKDWIIGVMESYFRGEEEIKATDERQIEYYKKAKKSYPKRRLKHILSKIFKKNKKKA